MSAESSVAPELSVEVRVPTADAMRDLGTALATTLRADDVVLLSGPLGAGKTTLTQGIGRGLDVRGQVASPTFVLARVHQPRHEGPALVHVDAYRLGSAAELDDLDLDTDLGSSVTVIEWGSGVAESLSDERLEIVIDRDAGAGPEDELRVVRVTGVGARWARIDLVTALRTTALRPPERPQA